jgi:predicted nuclease of predicted toxin-antitoxin system
MPSPPWASLLDENMPKRAATALRTAGYSAARVVEVGLRAQKDPVIFAYARARGLIIITRDADFLASHYQPPHAGIILLSLPGVP